MLILSIYIDTKPNAFFSLALSCYYCSRLDFTLHSCFPFYNSHVSVRSSSVITISRSINPESRQRQGRQLVVVHPTLSNVQVQRNCNRYLVLHESRDQTFSPRHSLSRAIGNSPSLIAVRKGAILIRHPLTPPPGLNQPHTELGFSSVLATILSHQGRSVGGVREVQVPRQIMHVRMSWRPPACDFTSSPGHTNWTALSQNTAA